MNLQDHIEYIRNRCLDAIGNNDKMSVASFESGEGLIMTFNEAIEIVNEIERLKAEQKQLEKEKAELLEALKSALSCHEKEYKIGLDSYRAFFECDPDFESEQWKIPEWVEAAKTAIENAEKTKQ
jgi:hypothetical protein